MSLKKKMDELKRLSVEEYKKTPKNNLSLVLDSVRSANNVGSIFRTADAFRVKKIYLTGYCPKPPHKEIQKTALGATESIDWEYNEDIICLINQIKQNPKNTFLALEQVHNSLELQKFVNCKEKNYFLIVGNEVEGVSQSVVDLCHQTIEIPQEGTKHSLNVAVSTGIAIWEIVKR